MDAISQRHLPAGSNVLPRHKIFPFRTRKNAGSLVGKNVICPAVFETLSACPYTLLAIDMNKIQEILLARRRFFTILPSFICILTANTFLIPHSPKVVRPQWEVLRFARYGKWFRSTKRRCKTRSN